jgi:hypothetical protein
LQTAEEAKVTTENNTNQLDEGEQGRHELEIDIPEEVPHIEISLDLLQDHEAIEIFVILSPVIRI